LSQLQDTTTSDLTNRYSNRVRVYSTAVQMDIQQLAEVAGPKPMSQLWNAGRGGMLPRWRWLYECGGFMKQNTELRKSHSTLEATS